MRFPWSFLEVVVKRVPFYLALRLFLLACHSGCGGVHTHADGPGPGVSCPLHRVRHHPQTIPAECLFATNAPQLFRSDLRRPYLSPFLSCVVFVIICVRRWRRWRMTINNQRRSTPPDGNYHRNYYDTLAAVFGDRGVSAQLPALLNALPKNKRKLLQDVADGLNKK